MELLGGKGNLQFRMKASVWGKCYIQGCASYRILNRCPGLGGVHIQREWGRIRVNGARVEKGRGEGALPGRKVCKVSRAEA